MYIINLISTIHKEIGNCNCGELFSILERLKPDIIFLEALDSSYTNYEHDNYINFDVSHKRLELSAIQKYFLNIPWGYVPVLNKGLSEPFYEKQIFLSRNIILNDLLEEINSLTASEGFEFLNSESSIELHEKMRQFENELLKGNDLNEKANQTIDEYENSMIQNIYKYCNENQFERGIFMCGNAHRKSIIEKIKKVNSQDLKLNWVDLNNEPLT